MEERIKMLEALAREKHLARQHFLVQRENQMVRDELIKTQTAPIVAPIVEAIEKNAIQSTTKVVPLSEGDIGKFYHELEKLNFENLKRNKYIRFVSDIYQQDEKLFNPFLVLNKEGVYHVPIQKMLKYGVVESLIFYGQGGTKLDLVPVSMQTEKFKTRLSNYDEFYNNNYETIQRVLEKASKDEEEGAGEEEGAEKWGESESVKSGDWGEYADARANELEEQTNELEEQTNDIFDSNADTFTGDGLVERLSILHASKNAGNTSLDIENEAQPKIF